MAQPQEFTVFLASASANTLDAREAVAEVAESCALGPWSAAPVRRGPILPACLQRTAQPPLTANTCPTKCAAASLHR